MQVTPGPPGGAAAPEGGVLPQVLPACSTARLGAIQGGHRELWSSSEPRRKPGVLYSAAGELYSQGQEARRGEGALDAGVAAHAGQIREADQGPAARRAHDARRLRGWPAYCVAPQGPHPRDDSAEPAGRQQGRLLPRRVQGPAAAATPGRAAAHRAGEAAAGDPAHCASTQGGAGLYVTQLRGPAEHHERAPGQHERETYAAEGRDRRPPPQLQAWQEAQAQVMDLQPGMAALSFSPRCGTFNDVTPLWALPRTTPGARTFWQRQTCGHTAATTTGGQAPAASCNKVLPQRNPP
ncbi:hypothetical protein IscW_ISCW004414, partial [Ixodes scapularis]